jgi:hypothetical protein
VIAFIVVKDRLFCTAVYRLYRDQRDVDAVRRDATEWADAITRANS